MREIQELFEVENELIELMTENSKKIFERNQKIDCL